jgi:ubiquitin carboxyl-terminal hydrolase 16/45
VIPAPAAKEGGVVDQTHDLEPKSEADRAKLEKLFQERQSADELQGKGILKGKSNPDLRIVASGPDEES